MRRSIGALANSVPPYVRYIAVSGGALGVDLGFYFLALSTGVAATLAAAVGYLSGVAVHWILSSRLVFDDVAERGLARTKQKALFLTSAFVGLGLTVGIVALATRIGFDARLAKLVAVAVSFQTTYLLRRTIVFA
jgi:putative flippase GtrA